MRKEFSFIIFSKFDPKDADLRTSSLCTLHRSQKFSGNGELANLVALRQRI